MNEIMKNSLADATFNELIIKMANGLVNNNSIKKSFNQGIANQGIT